MAFLKLSGGDAPSPTGFQVERVPITSGERRSASGRAVVDYVGVKSRILMEYAYLTDETLAAIRAQASQMGVFEVTYPEPGAGDKTVQAYIVDFSAGLMRILNGKKEWRDVRLTLMEV